MKTIPHILESTQNNREFISDMCGWALEIEDDNDTFQTEAYTDGDVFQAMAALARVNFFGTDTSNDEESQSESSNNGNIQHNEDEHAGDPGNNGEDDDVIPVHDLRNETDSDCSGGSVHFDSEQEDST